MSDDLPPVIDLASFRAGRARSKVDADPTIDASIEDGCLWLEVEGGLSPFGLDAEAVKWLKDWIHRFEAEQARTVPGPLHHRCWTCGLQKWIECRGHWQPRTHHLDHMLTESVAVGSCGRKTRARRFAETWDEVDCANCLRRKPKAVP